MLPTHEGPVNLHRATSFRAASQKQVSHRKGLPSALTLASALLAAREQCMIGCCVWSASTLEECAKLFTESLRAYQDLGSATNRALACCVPVTSGTESWP